jgi:FkbM family methyltransferase
MYSLRGIVERLTRHIVIRRTMPDAFGRLPFYVSPSAGLKYLFKPIIAIDPPLLSSAMLVGQGDTVWDIGANVGLFSVAAAARAGKSGQVIAFEPDIWLVGLLRRTRAAVKRSESSDITIIPVAISDSIAFRYFHIAKRSRASNALAGYGQSQMGDIEEVQIVPTFNLDWLLGHFPPPQVLKIDVEGAELEVLSKQTRMLHEVRPTIICEVASSSAPEMTALLCSAEYILYDGEMMLEGARPISQAPWSTIALPKERKRDTLLHMITA